MNAQSLRRRLLLFAFGGILVSLVLTGLLLSALFERHVSRRIVDELDNHVSRIAGNLTIDANGAITLPVELADARFNMVFDGLYWQVLDEADGQLLRSKSLWDDSLELPTDKPALGVFHTHYIEGPREQSLMVRERRIELGDAANPVPVRIAVAIDLADIHALQADFSVEMVVALALLGLLLFGGLLLQVRLGLGPLDSLRGGIAQIREGRTARLTRNLPEEVLPLVDEINTLLADKEKEMEQARNRAADLAHGLKTPLTILAGDIRRLREKGDNETAANIDSVSQIMRRHIERQLALSRRRAAGQMGSTVKVRPQVERLVATLSRLPGREELDYRLEIPDGAIAGMGADDFNDVIGNLLENASRHAASMITLTAKRRGNALHLSVADDGPGVPPGKLDAILLRGIRLDEKAGGSGLGLAIAGDILEAYGSKLEAAPSPLGGLEIGFELPPARESGI